MKDSQMSEGERETYASLVNETKPVINKHRRKVVISSIVVFLVVLGVIIWYWRMPTVTHSTSLLIGGALYGLWGALLLALGAVSNPTTVGLMSMTRYDANHKLFAELMKSRLNARVGIMFLVGTFSIQAATTLTFGN